MPKRHRFGWAVIAVFLLSCTVCRAESEIWRMLDEGLYIGGFASPKRAQTFNYPIIILRIDPDFYSLQLLSASEHGGRARTAEQWCKEFHQVAAINASMYFDTDPLKSTGYMRNFDHVNNSHFNPAFGAFMVFNPVLPSLPAVQIVDRQLEEGWENLIKKYQTVVQNYRMISEGRKIGWPQQEKVYRAAAIGMDIRHHVLFILSRSPYSTHDLIHILLSLPIDLQQAMYVEGGSEATLHYEADEKTKDRMRRSGGDVIGFENEKSAWTIPNVIGVSKRR